MPERGVVESSEVDGVVLWIAQRPLAPWLPLPAIPAILVLLVAGVASWGAALVLGAVFVAVGAGATTWQTTVRVEVTPARTRVVGWVGRLPLPDDRNVLTPGLRASASPGLLRMSFAGEVLELRGLRATSTALAHVARRVDEQRRLVEAVRAPAAGG